MAEYEDYISRAEEALASAQILLENQKFNSAMSEAYYCMFYSAKALLSFKDFHPKKHKGVLALLGLEFVNKGYIEEVYGKIFAKNMELREKADYDVSFRASEEEAKR
ncbi:MAG: HEPN domain-containing protein [Candidatus Freyarchaeota archaeon]